VGFAGSQEAEHARDATARTVMGPRLRTANRVARGR
jgi:hypothetical protein